VVYERYHDLKIEPPEPKSIDRLIRSAVRTADEQFYTTTTDKLSPVTRVKLDALLNPTTLPDGTTDNTSILQQLRSDAGACKLNSVLAEIEKLKQIRALDLPSDLFSQSSSKVVSWYRQRVAVEDLSEIRRHPEHIRYTLLSAYCYQREREITDTLLDLLIDLIHKIEKRAERTVDKQILKDVKRIRGKHRLLYEVARVSIERPEGTIKEVIYPVAPEQTLRDLVQEFKAGGLYDIETADKLFQELITRFPGNVWGYIGWGDMYRNFKPESRIIGNYDKAKEKYRLGLARCNTEIDVITDRLDDLGVEQRKLSLGAE